MCGFPCYAQRRRRLLWKLPGLFVISWLCRDLRCWEEQILMFHSHRKRVRDVERGTIWVEFSHMFLLHRESRAGIWYSWGQVVFLPSFFLVAWESSHEECTVLAWTMTSSSCNARVGKGLKGHIAQPPIKIIFRWSLQKEWFFFIQKLVS